MISLKAAPNFLYLNADDTALNSTLGNFGTNPDDIEVNHHRVTKYTEMVGRE